MGEKVDGSSFPISGAEGVDNVCGELDSQHRSQANLIVSQVDAALEKRLSELCQRIEASWQRWCQGQCPPKSRSGLLADPGSPDECQSNGMLAILPGDSTCRPPVRGALPGQPQLADVPDVPGAPEQQLSSRSSLRQPQRASLRAAEAAQADREQRAHQPPQLDPLESQSSIRSRNSLRQPSHRLSVRHVDADEDFQRAHSPAFSDASFQSFGSRRSPKLGSSFREGRSSAGLLKRTGSMVSMPDRSSSNGRGLRASGVEMDTAILASMEKLARTSQITDNSEDEDLTFWRRVQVSCKRLVVSWPFEIFSAVAVISNSVLIGVQVELAAHDLVTNGPDDTQPAWLMVLNQVYALVFLVELVVRLAAEGMSFFKNTKMLFWNYFDIAIVTSSLLDTVTSIMMAVEGDAATDVSIASNFRLIRIIRISRIVRVMRMIKVLRFVRALRSLVHSIMCTLKALMWSMLLLGIIMYAFGVIFTDCVISHFSELGHVQTDTVLYQSFGSVHFAMHTLFRSISGGIDWDVAVRPLIEVSWVWGYLFTSYIAFCTFAVLNVMTGVFVQSAMESASRDHEMLAQAMQIDRQRHVDTITKLFETIDQTSSGSITLFEFESRLEDDSVRTFFQSLELQITDAWTLFKLLDSEGSGTVEITDFVDGCLKLKGPAKSIDIACILSENKKLRRKIGDFEESFVGVEAAINAIHRAVCHPAPGGNRSSRSHGHSEAAGRADSPVSWNDE